MARRSCFSMALKLKSLEHSKNNREERRIESGFIIIIIVCWYIAWQRVDIYAHIKMAMNSGTCR